MRLPRPWLKVIGRLVYIAFATLLLSFFSLRFIYSSINNPLILFHSNFCASVAFKLVRKMSYEPGRLPKTTVANFFEDVCPVLTRVIVRLRTSYKSNVSLDQLPFT